MADLITAVRLCEASTVESAGCYALLYAEQGDMRITLRERALAVKAGEVCLLSPGEAPLLQTSGAVLIRIPAALAVQSALSPLFAHFLSGARVECLGSEKSAFFATVMGDILQISPDAPFAAQRMLARVIDLITALPAPRVLAQGDARGKITAAVLSYIEENISRAISLDDIAAALFISKYHMSHVFKSENGISVGEAVLRRKVAHAEALLAAGVPAHRASEMVGFNHYSAFFRIFKRIAGRAPTEAR